MDTILSTSLESTLLFLTAFAGAFVAATWISLIVWTLRDIKTRSTDRITHVLAAVLVGVLYLPGLVVYHILRPSHTMEEAYQRTLEEEMLLSSIEHTKRCPGCDSHVRDDWQICPKCHTRVQKSCEICMRFLDLTWQICPYCATPVSSAKVPSAHSAIPIDET